MTDHPHSKGKRRYEPPSITGPEFDDKNGHSPAGVTGCAAGSQGGRCANGISPQGGPSMCHNGAQPNTANCATGTAAPSTCGAGTNAITTCKTGTTVQADCTNGITPIGANCSRGTTASACGVGTVVV